MGGGGGPRLVGRPTVHRLQNMDLWQMMMLFNLLQQVLGGDAAAASAADGWVWPRVGRHCTSEWVEGENMDGGRVYRSSF